MSFVTLNAKIKEKLEGITKIQDVKDDPLSDFSGYPACYIVPTDSESNYDTTIENRRTYNFTVRIFYKVGDSDSEVQEAYNAMRELVDEVLDTFDQDYTLSGINLPSGSDMLGVAALPSLWVYLEQVNLLVAEIKISARINVEIV